MTTITWQDDVKALFELTPLFEQIVGAHPRMAKKEVGTGRNKKILDAYKDFFPFLYPKVAGSNRGTRPMAGPKFPLWS